MLGEIVIYIEIPDHVFLPNLQAGYIFLMIQPDYVAGILKKPEAQKAILPVLQLSVAQGDHLLSFLLVVKGDVSPLLYGFCDFFSHLSVNLNWSGL